MTIQPASHGDLASRRPISGSSAGIAVTRRSPVEVLAKLLRNPLHALPPEIFDHPLVYGEFAGTPRLYIADPVLIHEALVKNAGALDKGEDVRRALGPALGDGLLTADGSSWKWQRQSVASGFQWEKLRSFLPAMIAAAERRRDQWTPGMPLDIGREMMHATFDIIVETMMSGRERMDVGAVEKSVNDYLAPSNWMLAFSLFKVPEWFPFPGKTKAAAAVTYLRAAMAEMIAERRARPEDRADLIALLLAARDPETGQGMSDEQIIDNLMTFISAGHETTALGLAWTLHLLARHPEVEERVRAELGAVVGEGPVQPAHVEALSYLKQVFSEAMRLYPPAPILARRAQESFPLGDHTVPAGMNLVVPVHAVHRHTLLWTDPERFDPDRFAPEAAKSRHRYAYMPFGAGPRVCIGSAFATMEAVAILAVLLQRFRLENCAASTPEAMMRITLRPKTRLMMMAHPAT